MCQIFGNFHQCDILFHASPLGCRRTSATTTAVGVHYGCTTGSCDWSTLYITDCDSAPVQYNDILYGSALGMRHLLHPGGVDLDPGGVDLDPGGSNLTPGL